MTDKPWPPPNGPPATFLPHATVHINAPASRVWADPSTWPSWNTWVSSTSLVTLADGSKPSDPATASSKMQKGVALLFHPKMQMLGRETQVTTPVKVERYEEGRDEVGSVWHVDWSAAEHPWLLRCLRLNEVEVVGEGECVYRSCEYFTGPQAYVVKWMMGTQLQELFERWGSDLKKGAEGKGTGA